MEHQNCCERISVLVLRFLAHQGKAGTWMGPSTIVSLLIFLHYFLRADLPDSWQPAQRLSLFITADYWLSKSLLPWNQLGWHNQSNQWNSKPWSPSQEKVGWSFVSQNLVYSRCMFLQILDLFVSRFWVHDRIFERIACVGRQASCGCLAWYIVFRLIWTDRCYLSYLKWVFCFVLHRMRSYYSKTMATLKIIYSY